MPADIYSLGAATITVAGDTPASFTLPLESHAFSADIIDIIHHHSGNMSPTAVLVPGANPRISLSMPFETAFTALGLGMRRLSAWAVYLSRFEDYMRAPGAEHARLNNNTGAAASAQIVGWRVGVDGVVNAVVDIVPLAANSNDHPAALTEDVALPALTGSPILHTLGPLVINGAAPTGPLAGLVSVAGAINGLLDVRRHDGDRYPRVAARYQVAPDLLLAHADPVAVMRHFSLLGLSMDGAINAVQYFRQYDNATGVNRGDGGAVAITIESGRIHQGGPDSSQGQVSMTDVRIIGINADGVTSPLSIVTNAVPPNVP